MFKGIRSAKVETLKRKPVTEVINYFSKYWSVTALAMS